MELGRVDGAVICSVVPVLVPVLSQVVQRLTGITPYIVTSRSKSGLTLAIPEGDTLGNDILAADAAAAAEYPLPAIIFDNGFQGRAAYGLLRRLDGVQEAFASV